MPTYLQAKREIENFNMEFDAYLSRDRSGEAGLSRPNVEQFVERIRAQYRPLAESTIKQDRMEGEAALDCLRSYELIWKRQEEMHLEDAYKAREKSKFLDDALNRVVRACEKHDLPMPEDIQERLSGQYDAVVTSGAKPSIAYSKSQGFIVRGK